MSVKLIKAIKSKDFVHFNELLPSSLYDPSQLSSFNLQIFPSELGKNKESFPPAKCPTQRISDHSSWLEAWNMFIRASVHFHPYMAQELLAYQETVCTLQWNYPFHTWSKYDIAFRLSIATNKSLSWAMNINEYLFNKYIRCNATPTTVSIPQPRCFKCSTPGHYGNACPKQTYHLSFLQQW